MSLSRSFLALGYAEWLVLFPGDGGSSPHWPHLDGKEANTGDYSNYNSHSYVVGFFPCVNQLFVPFIYFYF